MSFTASTVERFDEGPFQTLDVSTPGQLGSIPTGSLICHYIGATDQGDAGGSGIVKAAALETFKNTTGIVEIFYGFWFRLKDFGAATPPFHSTPIWSARDAGGTDQIMCVVQSDRTFAVWDGGGQIPLSTTLNPEAWYYARIGIYQPGGINEYHVTIKDINNNTVATGARSGVFILQPVTKVGICNKLNGASATYWRGRVSLVDYKTGDGVNYPNDGAYPLFFPPAGPFNWLASASGGANQNRNGTTAQSWPLNADFLAYEFTDGIFQGDTVTIDNSFGTWDVGAKCLSVANAYGFTLTFVGESRWYKDISGATAGGTTVWTRGDAAGAPNTWETTDGGATDLANVIIYRNGVAITTHVTGANYAAVKATLDAAGQKYYSDGTKLYLNDNGTNPNTSGVTLLRSRDRLYPGSATHGAPAILYNGCSGTHVLNSPIIKYTGFVSPTDNNSIFEGDAVRVIGCPSINFTCNNSITDGCGKHHITFGIDNTVQVRITLNNPVFGRGHPYCGAGGWTTTAFNINVGGSGDCQAVINNPVSTDTSGVNPFVLAHGVADSWSSITVNNAICPGQGVATNDGSATLVTLNNCEFYTLGATVARNITMNRGTLRGGISGPGISCWDVKIIPVDTLVTGNSRLTISGTINLYNCTIDVSGSTPGDGNSAFLYRTAALTMTVAGLIWKDGGKDIAFVANAAAGEITIDDNLIEKPTGNRWMENYNGADRTLTQWQALGFDTHSLSTADAKAAAPTYKLSSTSQARGLVSLTRWPALAGTRDNSNRTRPTTGTTDAGALQFAPPTSGIHRQLPIKHLPQL